MELSLDGIVRKALSRQAIVGLYHLLPAARIVQQLAHAVDCLCRHLSIDLDKVKAQGPDVGLIDRVTVDQRR